MNHALLYIARSFRANRMTFTCVFLPACLLTMVSSRAAIVEMDYERPPTICTTPVCLEESRSILSNMNQDMDPCEDMYEYACGDYIHKTSIPSHASSWRKLDDLHLENLNVLKKIIEERGNIYRGQHSSAIAKLKTVYNTCMDIKRIEKLGIAPILKLINSKQSWTVTSTKLRSWNRNKWTIHTSLLAMHKIGRSSLFFFIVDKDLIDSSSGNVIMFYQPDLTLGNLRDYSESKYKDAYLAFAVRVGVLLGGNEIHVANKMKAVYDFEKSLAEITVPRENQTDPREQYNKITLAEFQNIMGDWIDIRQYLSEMFKGRAFKMNEGIVVSTLPYFQKLKTVILATDKEVLANYMMWNMLKSLVRYFPEDFSLAELKLKKVRTGQTSLSERWKRCLEEANYAVGFAFSALFVENKFSHESKIKVTAVLEEVKQQFAINLHSLSWMDEITHRRLKDKINAITLKVGYPDWIRDPIKLDQRYKQLHVIEGEYLTNKLGIVTYLQDREHSKYGKARDPEEWDVFPSEVNAFYNFVNNEIIIPAGILQPPFYSPDLPEPYIYGTVGAVVGHELIHGFDSSGRHFNKDGVLTDWWTETVAEAYDNSAKCMVDQYSAYEVQGNKLNGILTLGENIADNGGVKFAFRAFKSSPKRSRIILPDIDLTEDQLFFLGFSQFSCAHNRPEFENMSIAMHKHALPKYRVIGPLSNSEEFAAAFSCSSRSKMNPCYRCHVW